jgi:hypothetical protein
MHKTIAKLAPDPQEKDGHDVGHLAAAKRIYLLGTRLSVGR